MKKLDWEKIWGEFETWFQKTERRDVCKTCNQPTTGNSPEWSAQQRKIQNLVNKRIQ